MKKKDEFYVGWNEEVPSWYRKFSFIVIGSLAIITLVFTILWISKSSNFVASRFDFGNETIYKGVIYEYPVPILTVFQTDDTLAIPLVNFGKAGVAKPIRFFTQALAGQPHRGEVRVRLAVVGMRDQRDALGRGGAVGHRERAAAVCRKSLRPDPDSHRPLRLRA